MSETIKVTFEGELTGVLKAFDTLAKKLDDLEAKANSAAGKIADAFKGLEQTVATDIAAAATKLKSLSTALKELSTINKQDMKTLAQRLRSIGSALKKFEVPVDKLKDLQLVAGAVGKLNEKLKQQNTQTLINTANALKTVASSARTMQRAMNSAGGSVNALGTRLTGLAAIGSRVFKKMSAEAQFFGKIVTNVANTIVRRFGSIALSFATIGVGVVTGRSVKLISDFETAIANVGTILDDAVPPLEQFRQGVLGLGQATSKDLVDLTEALYDAISAGITRLAPVTDETDQLAAANQRLAFAIDFVKQAALAAQAGLTDTQSAVKAGTVILNTFGTAAGTSGEIFDKLQTAVKLGVFRFEQLAVAIGKGAGIAERASLSFDEYLAGITAISTKGRTASQSVTALRQLILAIVRPNSKALKIAEKYGFQLGQNAVIAKGFGGVLKDITNAIGENVGALGQVIPRVEGLVGAAALGADDLRRFDETLSGIGKSSGEVAAAAAIQEKTVAVQFAKLRNQFDKAAIEIGEGITPVLVEAFVSIRRSLEAFDREGAKQFFKDLAEGALSLAKHIASLKETFAALFKVVLIAVGFKFLRGIIATLGGLVINLTANLQKLSLGFLKNRIEANNHSNALRTLGANLAVVGDLTARNVPKTKAAEIATRALASATKVLNAALSAVGLAGSILGIISLLAQLPSMFRAAGTAAAKFWLDATGEAEKLANAVKRVADNTDDMVRRLKGAFNDLNKETTEIASKGFVEKQVDGSTFEVPIFDQKIVDEVDENGEKIKRKVVTVVEEAADIIVKTKLAEFEKRKELAKQELDAATVQADKMGELAEKTSSQFRRITLAKARQLNAEFKLGVNFNNKIRGNILQEVQDQIRIKARGNKRVLDNLRKKYNTEAELVRQGEGKIRRQLFKEAEKQSKLVRGLTGGALTSFGRGRGGKFRDLIEPVTLRTATKLQQALAAATKRTVSRLREQASSTLDLRKKIELLKEAEGERTLQLISANIAARSEADKQAKAAEEAFKKTIDNLKKIKGADKRKAARLKAEKDFAEAVTNIEGGEAQKRLKEFNKTEQKKFRIRAEVLRFAGQFEGKLQADLAKNAEARKRDEIRSARQIADLREKLAQRVGKARKFALVDLSEFTKRNQLLKEGFGAAAASALAANRALTDPKFLAVAESLGELSFFPTAIKGVFADTNLADLIFNPEQLGGKLFTLADSFGNTLATAIRGIKFDPIDGKAVIASIKGAAKGIGSFFTDVFEGIGDFFSPRSDAQQERSFERHFAEPPPFVEGMEDFFLDTLRFFNSANLGDELRAAGRFLVDLAGDAVDLFSNGFQGAANFFQNVFAGAANLLITGIAKAAGFLLSAFGDFLSLAASTRNPLEDPEVQRQVKEIREGLAPGGDRQQALFASADASSQDIARKKAEQAEIAKADADAAEKIAELNGNTFAKVLEDEFDRRIQIIENFTENLPVLFEKLVPFIDRFMLAITNALPIVLTQFAAGIPPLISRLIAGLPMLVQALVRSLPEVISALIDQLPQLIEEIIVAVVALLPVLSTEIVLAFIDAFTKNIDKFIIALVEGIVEGVTKAIGNTFSGEGLLGSIPLIGGPLSSAAGAIGGFAKKIPGIGGLFQQGGIVQSFQGGGFVQQQENVLKEMFGQIRNGGIPIIAHPGEAVFPADVTRKMLSTQATTRGDEELDTGGQAVNVVFNQKNDMGRMVAKLFTDMFVAEANRQGGNVRSVRDVVGKTVTNLPDIF